MPPSVFIHHQAAALLPRLFLHHPVFLPPPPPRPLPRRMAAIRAAQGGESDNATRAAEVGEDGKGTAHTKEGCELSEKT